MLVVIVVTLKVSGLATQVSSWQASQQGSSFLITQHSPRLSHPQNSVNHGKEPGTQNQIFFSNETSTDILWKVPPKLGHFSIFSFSLSSHLFLPHVRMDLFSVPCLEHPGILLVGSCIMHVIPAGNASVESRGRGKEISSNLSSEWWFCNSKGKKPTVPCVPLHRCQSLGIIEIMISAGS